jgi:hypothetical protein
VARPRIKLTTAATTMFSFALIGFDKVFVVLFGFLEARGAQVGVKGFAERPGLGIVMVAEVRDEGHRHEGHAQLGSRPPDERI